MEGDTVNKFLTNLKYGWSLFKIPMFILLIMCAIVSVVLAYNVSEQYNLWYFNYLSTHTLAETQAAAIFSIKAARLDFWSIFLFYMSFFIAPIYGYYLSQDEENEMNGILIMHTSKNSLLFSRIVVLLCSSLILSLIGGLILIFLFYSVNGVFIGIYPDIFVVFPIVFIFSLLGALVGVSFKKKHWAIVVAIFLVLILFLVHNVAHSMGDNYMSAFMGKHTSSLNLGEYRAHYPLLWKTLIFVSPQALIEILNPVFGFESWNSYSTSSISLLGFWGDVVLMLLWIILLFAALYLIFSYRHRNVLEVMR